MSHEVITKAQALLRENERIFELENQKMEELSNRNNLLYNNLNAWHSQLNAIIEEYNQKVVINDEDLRRQALESVQSARLEAIEKFQDILVHGHVLEQAKRVKFSDLVLTEFASKAK